MWCEDCEGGLLLVEKHPLGDASKIAVGRTDLSVTEGRKERVSRSDEESSMNADQTPSLPRITITPERALLDERVHITLSGFPANIEVTLQASTQDDEGKEWRSQATFLPGEHGFVDVSSQPPLRGSYRTADPMGLFWSMTVTSGKGKQPASFVKTDLAVPTTITLRAQTNARMLATAQAERHHRANGVTELLVGEHGLIGKLFLPADPGPHPGLLVLSGSDGTVRERGAALLASHGYVALALAYFGAVGLPKRLARVSLDYFQHGIHWLQQRPEVARDQIGVIGPSRGGELALLLGAMFQEIRAVVASAPSGLMHGGVGTAPWVPAWIYQGKPLPHIVYKPTVSELVEVLSAMIRRTPFVGRPLYLKELDDQQAMERATIPVEKIQGSLLLISGEEDELWPSTLYAERLMERLSHHHHPFPYKHLRYKGAGHLIGIPYSFPYLPPAIAPLPNGLLVLAFGGSPQASAYADADSWTQTLVFLEESLNRPN